MATGTPAPTPPGQKPRKPSDYGKSLIVLLVGAAAALAAGVTTLADTGTIGRVQRNHPWWLTAAIALAVWAACCFVMASLVARETPWTGGGWTRPIFFWEWTAKAWRVNGVVAAFLAVAVGFWASIKTTGEVERPIIEVQFDARTLTLTGSAKVRHLSSNDPLNVSVEAMTVVDGRYRAVRLFEASLGPDSDGNATQTLKVHVPPGRYEAVGVQASVAANTPKSCGQYPDAAHIGIPTDVATSVTDVKAADPVAAGATKPVKEQTAKSGTACMIVGLPPLHQRPHIDAHWHDTRRRMLSLAVTVANAPVGRDIDQLVHVEVVGRSTSGRTAALYRAISEADPSGLTRRNAQVAIPAAIARVCVRAHLAGADDVVALPRCSTAAAISASTIELRGPGVRRPAARHCAERRAASS